MLFAATAAFVLTHFASSTPLRGAAVRSVGEKAWVVLYVLVAFATLGWMILAYGRAPRGEPLWTPLRLAPLLAMPFALVLLAAGYWRNPTMVGAGKLLKSEDPARGMIRVTRHPIMWAIILWATAHVLARGDVKSVVFFGGFLILAALGTVLIDSRKKASPDWARFAAVTSNLPFVAILQGRNRLAWREIGWLRPLAGIAAFLGFFLLHPWLFGARPY